MKEENNKIMIKQNEDGTAFVIIKESGREFVYHLVTNKNFDFKKKYDVKKAPKIGKIAVPALLTTLVLASGIFSVYKGKELVDSIKEQKKENELVRNSLDYYIENKDINILKMFFDEALNDLTKYKDNNLEAENIYKAMYNELCLAEKENYAVHIKEGVKLASDANIYFGVGKYEKYLNAKNINGEIYFPLESAIPTYSEENLAGNIVITYLPNDTTPYVSAKELEEFNKNKEIDAYINTL